MGTAKMMDLQRQRLKYLLANAILELWKKETGSLSSVVIEGTICITSGSGKTTVVQVSDKFFGSVPGSESLDSTYGPGTGYTSLPSDCSGGGAPWGVVSPTGTGRDEGYQSHETESDSSGTLNFSKHENPKDIDRETSPPVAKKAKVPSQSVKQTSGLKKQEHNSEPGQHETQLLKYGERDENFNTPVAFGVGGYCPGTGYYTCSNEDKESINNQQLSPSDQRLEKLKKERQQELEDDIEESSETELTIDTGTQEQNDTTKDEDHMADVSGEDLGESMAMDLSRKDIELSVMSPQKCTAQVRSVIRQRLLASKNHEAPQPEKEQRASETPKPLKSLGLHRSPNSSDEENSPGARPWPLLAMNNVVQQVGQTLSPGGSMFPQDMPHYPMVPPLPPGLMVPSPVMGMNPAAFHNMMKRKSSGPPMLIPFGPPPLTGCVPSTSPLMGNPPVALKSPTGSVGSSKCNSPVVSPTGSTKDGKESSSDRESTGTSPEQRVYKCDFCSKTFLFKSKYHEHLPVHTNARPFQCHLCSRTYKYKYDLRVHLRTHMGIPTKSTVCPFCTTKFDTNKQLRIHIKESHRDQQKVTEEDCTDPKDNLPPAL